ncbi:MAG: PQQ-dependent dehydrogenase, methanol/ethanol family [Gemmatimonadetes bacterium]|nr:PQQ-dependent dehydrogenase, methanol/ethanol family [Gemmatimonadota bacterium]
MDAAMLQSGLEDPTQWLLYGGNYANYRHSPIQRLTPEAVPNLKLAWSFPTGTDRQFEVSPVVYDGIMYISSSYNRLFALDAATGELFWRYDHQQPDDLLVCCGPVNRGVAIAGDAVLMATLDARLIAFHRLSGEILWDTEIIDYREGYAATAAPLIVGDLAIIGIAGGEFGIRGFFDAYDVATGERVWRHYTVPAAGEPGVETWAGESYLTGGAPTWNAGAYDPETNTLFWTTGNPAPDWNGDEREGDNLYSDAVIAVDPDTGERKWYFQFTPHDVWDYDGNTQVFLVDMMRNGREVKALVQANRNGYFYILDRTDGRFISATAYVQANWATIAEDGRPIVNPEALPSEDPSVRVCPSHLGGMNGAWTGAYNPGLGLAYIPAVESCELYRKGIVAFIPGQMFLGGGYELIDVEAERSFGVLAAIDVRTGETRWRYEDPIPLMAGTLSTEGGVVFTGTQSGFALAFNAETGEEVWRHRLGGGVRSQPIAYEADGRVFVAIGAGNGTFLESTGAPDILPEGGQLFVFELP